MGRIKRKSTKGVSAVTVIKGNDGPTSVFIAGKPADQNVLARIKTAYRKRK